MKKFLGVFLAFTLLFLSGCTSKPKEDGKVIAASFYPVYIFTLNIVDGVEDLQVQCMAEQNTGCLHDYTITARDAKLLNDADVFVINGAGMEGFVEELYGTVDTLSVIDSSEGIELICDGEHEHHGGEEEDSSHGHSHEENSHIWMSVSNAKKQIINIKNGLVKAFPEYKTEFENNCQLYLERLEPLESEIARACVNVTGKKVVTFHAAYEYLAADLGMEIVDCIESDDGGEPSAKALAHLCDEIRETDVAALITEPQYSGSSVGVLSDETGVSVYTLDPITSGAVEKNAYESIMSENLKLIEKAVK